MTNKKIIVLGAGYAGLMAALRLEGRVKGLDASITLINGEANFVERPRLPEVAVGKILTERPICWLSFRPFIECRASRFDFNRFSRFARIFNCQ